MDIGVRHTIDPYSNLAIAKEHSQKNMVFLTINRFSLSDPTRYLQIRIIIKLPVYIFLFYFSYSFLFNHLFFSPLSQFSYFGASSISYFFSNSNFSSLSCASDVNFNGTLLNFHTILLLGSLLTLFFVFLPLYVLFLACILFHHVSINDLCNPFL